MTSSGFGFALVSGLFGPKEPLRFSEEQAIELRNTFKFPDSVRMHHLLTIWHETIIELDQRFENDQPKSVRELELNNLVTAATQIVNAIERLSPNAAHGVSILMEREAIASSDGDEPIYLFSLEQLQRQLDWLQRAARKRLDKLASTEPEKRYRRPDYPGLFYVVECMIAPFWREHKTKKFHADFSEEALPQPLNDCSRFTVQAVELFCKNIPTSAVRTGMKAAQKNFNSRRSGSTSAD